MADGPTTSELLPASTSQELSDRPSEPRRAIWREFPVLVVTALALAIVIKSFLVQAFFIPSTSMEPGLLVGDRILVCRICLTFSDPAHGDIIVFTDPVGENGPDRGVLGSAMHWLGEGIGVAKPDDVDFIKRVAGLPGDVLELDRRGHLFRNGTRVPEPYLAPPPDRRTFGPVTVPDGMLFVLGDNRLVSGDSRFEPPAGVGLIPLDRVVGRAFVVVWPVSSWGGID